MTTTISPAGDDHPVGHEAWTSSASRRPQLTGAVVDTTILHRQFLFSAFLIT